MPDGIEIVIDWKNFQVNASVFIPAINTTLLNKEMKQIAADKNIQLVGKELIEGGKWGMRFWRVL
jgi:hypothetical protein